MKNLLLLTFIFSSIFLASCWKNISEEINWNKIIESKNISITKEFENNFYILNERQLYKICKNDNIKTKELHYNILNKNFLNSEEKIDLSKIKLLWCDNLYYNDGDYKYILTIEWEEYNIKEPEKILNLNLVKNDKYTDFIYSQENDIINAIDISWDNYYLDKSLNKIIDIKWLKKEMFWEKIKNIWIISIKYNDNWKEVILYNFVDNLWNIIFWDINNKNTWLKNYFIWKNLIKVVVYYNWKAESLYNWININTWKKISENDFRLYNILEDTYLLFFPYAKKGEVLYSIYDSKKDIILDNLYNNWDLKIYITANNDYIIYLNKDKWIYWIDKQWNKKELIVWQDFNMFSNITIMSEWKTEHEFKIYCKNNDTCSSANSLVERKNFNSFVVMWEEKFWIYDITRNQFFSWIENKSDFEKIFIENWFIIKKLKNWTWNYIFWSNKTDMVATWKYYKFDKYKWVEVLALFLWDWKETKIYDYDFNEKWTCKNIIEQKEIQVDNWVEENILFIWKVKSKKWTKTEYIDEKYCVNEKWEKLFKF